jgi:hypothetical protein
LFSDVAEVDRYASVPGWIGAHREPALPRLELRLELHHHAILHRLAVVDLEIGIQRGSVFHPNVKTDQLLSSPAEKPFAGGIDVSETEVAVEGKEAVGNTFQNQDGLFGERVLGAEASKLAEFALQLIDSDLLCSDGLFDSLRH